MHLWSRPTELEDLAACAGLLPPVYKNVSDSLVQLWQRLLTSGGILSAVVGSPKPRSLSPVLAFGITYFVNDSLMQQIRRSRQPGLALVQRQLFLLPDDNYFSLSTTITFTSLRTI